MSPLLRVRGNAARPRRSDPIERMRENTNNFDFSHREGNQMMRSSGIPVWAALSLMLLPLLVFVSLRFGQ